MFCRNCGKDIGDDKFCQYCGSASDPSANVVVKVVTPTVSESIEQVGHSTLIGWTALVAAIVSVIIRLNNTVINVVQNENRIVLGIIKESYYVISQDAIKYIIGVMILQIGISLYFYSNTKTFRISFGTIVLVILSLVVQICAIELKIPVN